MDKLEIKETNGEYIICSGQFEDKLWDHREDDNYAEDFYWEPDIYVLSEFPNLTGKSIPNRLLFNTSYESKTYPYLEGIEARRNGDILHTKITFIYTWSLWKSPIKMDIFLKHLTPLLANIPGVDFETEIKQWEIDSYILGRFQLDTNCHLSEKIEEITKRISKLHSEVEHRLINDFSQNVLINQFDFPEKYINICNQYLMYFGEFLNDLGFPSDLSVDSRGNSVILTVEPHNKDESVSNIQKALVTYLTLPAANSLESIEPAEGTMASIKHQQLLAVIEHLKSQLRLQEALISAKDLHINSLTENNNHLTNINTILLSSHKESISKYNDNFSLLGGSIQLTEYKGKFYKINIERAFKHIINLMKSK